MSELQQILVKNYRGNQERATTWFKGDAAKLADQGYYPTSQAWAPGAYGCGHFLLALILCVVLIGFLVFVYMLLVKPDGTLTVTYQLRSAPSEPIPPPLLFASEKTCPRCAEQVKAAAQICRFCGHNFS